MTRLSTELLPCCADLIKHLHIQSFAAVSFREISLSLLSPEVLCQLRQLGVINLSGPPRGHLDQPLPHDQTNVGRLEVGPLLEYGFVRAPQLRQSLRTGVARTGSVANGALAIENHFARWRICCNNDAARGCDSGQRQHGAQCAGGSLTNHVRCPR